MTFYLSRALLEDLPTMIDMESELFGSDAWSPELMVAEISHPHSYYLVARPDGQPEVCGYGGLRVVPGSGVGDIQTLAVAANFRGVGLGRLLLEALLSQARSSGVREVFLEVRADNDVARALYEHCGFVAIDSRVGYYQPDNVDAIVMRVELSPAQTSLAVGHE
jgi:ribosomal-protein-alanine acetyltransferase